MAKDKPLTFESHMIERRVHPRTIVNIPAMILGVADPSNPKTATIVDMSKEGAQLRVDSEIRCAGRRSACRSSTWSTAIIAAT